MKTKLLDIMNSKEPLLKLLDKDIDDGTTSYRIGRNIKNLSSEWQNFEDSRISLVKKYGGEAKEDGSMEVLPENKGEYSKQINEILSQEIEVNVLPLNVEFLKGLSPISIMAIDWLLEIKKEV